MHPNKTYELTIDFTPSGDPEDTKNRIKDWLVSKGEDTFVEGVVENLDIDFDYEDQGSNLYAALGGELTPLIIYKYDHEYLIQLKGYLSEAYGDSVILMIKEIDTQTWMEGWKESFKPFATKHFIVSPPWESVVPDKDKQVLTIEPGMAFGTGQHATTQLCLRLIEEHYRPDRWESALDVGTGTGILAIALKKLGCHNLLATDIDADAMIATRENAKLNHVTVDLMHTSVPEGRTADIVIANILLVVIKRIFAELVGAMAKGGRLLLSGILEEELDELLPLLRQHHLEVAETLLSGGWAALLLRESHES